ncbi:MAG: type VI secretion system baseplate subunit TssK [Polyangiaceae bacterium]|nr:type VI secretion system baseplate subunit TssK [Polyangiaceae bacterium]
MFQKPLWTEGLFVSQHHFQAQDRYHEDRVDARLSGLHRFGWGISLLEIDERLFQAGQFALRRLVAVWPDGLVVDCGGTDGAPLPAPRPFEPFFRPEQPMLDVLLGVSVEGTSNVAPTGEAPGQQRFGRMTIATDDFNTGGVPQEVEFALPNVRILFAGERQDRLATIPVAQLIRQADGRIVLRDTFVPPVLHLAAAPFLANGVRRVLGAMVARQRDLLVTRKQRNVASVEFHYTDARRFWLLHTLSGTIPVLTHLVETERAHPEEIYLALVRLVGQLATFSAEGEAVAVPRFDFAHLGDVFEPLFARALALLTVDSLPAYAEVPLQQRPDGMFLGRITEPRLLNHEFFVAVRSPRPEAEVRDRIPALMKVADWKQIGEVVKIARHGVHAEIEWNPSNVLPLKPGLCFFRLRREGPFWQEIAKTASIALYLPRDATWKDASLALYAVDPTYLR